MKFLCSVDSAAEAFELAAQLEEKGIPVVRSNERSNALLPQPRTTLDLWIALDSQYQDALSVLQNPGHEVATPIDVADFHRQLHALQTAPLGSGPPDRLLAIIVGSVIIVFVAWMAWAIATH